MYRENVNLPKSMWIIYIQSFRYSVHCIIFHNITSKNILDLLKYYVNLIFSDEMFKFVANSMESLFLLENKNIDDFMK